MTSKLKIAFVKWQDSWSNQRDYWTPNDLAKEQPKILWSTGIVVQDDKQGVTLAIEKDAEHDRYRHIQHIPRQAIHSFRIIGKV